MLRSFKSPMYAEQKSVEIGMFMLTVPINHCSVCGCETWEPIPTVKGVLAVDLVQCSTCRYGSDIWNTYWTERIAGRMKRAINPSGQASGAFYYKQSMYDFENALVNMNMDTPLEVICAFLDVGFPTLRNHIRARK